MGEITVRGRKFPIAGHTPTDAEQKAIANFLAAQDDPRVVRTRQSADEISAATAAAGDVGPDVVRGQSVDAEGNVVRPASGVTQTVDSEGVQRFSSPDPYEPSGPKSGGQNRSFTPRAEDALTRAADTLSFGLLPKASAKIGELQGKGTYDELLAKRRQEVKEAGERLGPAGAILADTTGGVLTGSALARGGATILGRVPANAGIIPKTVAGAVEGGLYGAASGAGHTDSDKPADYIENAKQGGLLGAVTGAVTTAVPAIGQRLITPFPAESAARTQLAQGLRDEGVTISAGQATGNPVLRYFEDVIAKLPFGTNPARGQMEQVTQAALRRAGIPNATHATADVLNDGFEQIGGRIGALQRQYPVQYDNQLIGELGAVQTGADVLHAADQRVINAFINRVLRPGASLDPTAMQALRTDLRLASTKGEKPLVDRALNDIRDAVDNGLERTIVATGDAADIVALQHARQHYAVLHTVADAINRSGPSGQRGVLTPMALKGALSTSIGKTQYARGEGDLQGLSRGSGGLLTSPPESGTATRMNLMEPHAPVLGAAGYLGVNNPVAQRYWGNQVAPNALPPSLLQPGAAGTGAAAGTPGGPADRLMESLLR